MIRTERVQYGPSITAVTVSHYLDLSLFLPFEPFSRSSLPDSLEIKSVPDGTEGVFVLRKLVKRTRFGPFEAKRVQHMDKQGLFPLRVSNCTALCCGRLGIMKSAIKALG